MAAHFTFLTHHPQICGFLDSPENNSSMILPYTISNNM